MRRRFPPLLAVVLAAGCTLDAATTRETRGSTGAGDTSSTGTTETRDTDTTGPAADGSRTAGESMTGGTTTSMSTDDGSTGSTGAPGPVCGDGVVEGEETCDDMNEVPDDGCKGCARDSVVFVSSKVYDGAINGLAGADQRCRMLAAQAELLRFETYRAWLSTSTMPAADRLLHSRGRYVLVNGLVVAQDWDALTSGNLENPIVVDEKSQTQDYGAWTGTLANGQPALGADFCADWTSDDGDLYGGAALTGMADAHWSYFEDVDCSVELHLYCIEQ